MEVRRTSCPGLHCACYAGGITVPMVPIAAAFGVAWIIEHLVEVAIVCGTCGALAVAASIALLRWADRRDDRRLAAWRPLHARAVPAVVKVDATPIAFSLGDRPALGIRDLHIHIDGMPTPEQGAVIRQALGWTDAPLDRPGPAVCS